MTKLSRICSTALFAVALFFLAGPSDVSGDAATKESTGMQTARTIENTLIPPIDARVPDNLAVAVFGLG